MLFTFSLMINGQIYNDECRKRDKETVTTGGCMRMHVQEYGTQNDRETQRVNIIGDSNK